MNFISISSHQQLLDALAFPLAESHVLIIAYNIIQNLGLELIEAINVKHNVNKIPYVLNCNNNLAYTIYAIEKQFPYVIFSHNNLSIFKNMQTMANLHKVKLFSNEHNMFEYF